jgi:hypothetical protein
MLLNEEKSPFSPAWGWRLATQTMSAAVQPRPSVKTRTVPRR